MLISTMAGIMQLQDLPGLVLILGTCPVCLVNMARFSAIQAPVSIFFFQAESIN